MKSRGWEEGKGLTRGGEGRREAAQVPNATWGSRTEAGVKGVVGAQEETQHPHGGRAGGRSLDAHLPAFPPGEEDKGCRAASCASEERDSQARDVSPRVSGGLRGPREVGGGRWRARLCRKKKKTKNDEEPPRLHGAKGHRS